MRKKIKVKGSTQPARSTRINAATDPESIHPALGSLDNEAYHAGYDLIAQGDSLENVSLQLIAREDTEIMPKITIWLDTSEMTSRRVIYYECKVQFPDIDTRDLDFHDSAEYIIGKFKRVGQFVTWMIDNYIELDSWVDEDENPII